MRYEKSCGAVVYRIHHGELHFLVEHMALGHTSIPKGHMEEGETEEETALREIKEETNLDVRLDTVFRHDISYSPAPGVQKLVIFFAAEALAGEMINQESEVAALTWMPWKQAVYAMTYEDDKEVLKHAAVYLSIKLSNQSFSVLQEAQAMGPNRGLLWYREHAVDIHSHTIVGVDDGAQSEEEALELLKQDWDEGIRIVYATPHYGIENGYAPSNNDIRVGFNRLCDAAQSAGLGIKVRMGTEWYCAEDIVDRIRNHEAWPMMDSDWYMVEFLEYGNVTEPAETILRRLKKMKDAGIKTILAHPERYKALQQDRDLAKRICDLGVLLQVNAYDLALNQKESTRGLAQWMAREGLVSFIGSDMHGTRPGKRTPRMKEGINWLYENIEDEEANGIVRVNAERYLGVERLLGPSSTSRNGGVNGFVNEKDRTVTY